MDGKSWTGPIKLGTRTSGNKTANEKLFACEEAFVEVVVNTHEHTPCHCNASGHFVTKRAANMQICKLQARTKHCLYYERWRSDFRPVDQIRAHYSSSSLNKNQRGIVCGVKGEGCSYLLHIVNEF